LTALAFFSSFRVHYVLIRVYSCLKSFPSFSSSRALRRCVKNSSIPIDFSRVRAVTFDVGGTLLDPHPSAGHVYAEVLARHHPAPDPEIIDARFHHAFADLRSRLLPVVNESTQRAFWRELAHRSLTPECPEEIFDTVFAELWLEFAHHRRWRPLPGAIALFENHAPGAVPSFNIFSNWDSRLHPVLDGLGWTPRFHHIFISSEIGFEKPDPRAFRAVAQALALPPEAILHVGDGYAHDYQAARAAGWQALLVTPHPPAAEPTAARINRLDELLPLLA
jgi:putative hydrolase of the HAD superfamily